MANTKAHRIRQKLLGGFLACLLGLSITPVALLHSLAANHVDGTAGKRQSPFAQVSKSTFSCHLANFVAESPFAPSAEVIVYPPAVVYRPLLVDYNDDLVPRFRLFIAHRGPPAA